MTACDALTKARQDARSLLPIIEAVRDEADAIRRLPDALANAFLERDVYRALLPVDLGGAGLDPVDQWDLVLEVSACDASVGWNYSLALGNGLAAGVLAPEVSQRIFASPDCGFAVAGAPTGRAVAAEGGYRVTGRWAWASGISQCRYVGGGCLVFDGDTPRTAPHGGPVVLHVAAPIEAAEVLDTWRTGGMRGTGSTEFTLSDVFVPDGWTFRLFGPVTPTQPHPIFRMPATYFGVPLAAVPLGAAMGCIAALKALAASKRLSPPRSLLAEEPSAQHTVAKAEAMVEAASLAVRSAFSQLWAEFRDDGEATMASRARVRRAMVHAVDTSIEAVGMCYREAGGSALAESARFERPLRDVNALAGHLMFQRPMMEDAGRVAMGLPPRLFNF
jgi:alkylation response protein AidB-like acyl-CoA dehydrogenase